MTAAAPSELRGSALSIRRLRTLLLIALVAGATVLIAVILTLVARLSDRVNPQVRADLEWRALRGASELSKTIDLGLAVGDASMVKEAFGAHTSSSDVLAIVAVNAEGAITAQHGRLPDLARLFRSQPGTVHVEPGYLTSWAPVEIEGGSVGKVAIVVSTARLADTEARLADVSRTAVIASVLGIVLGALVILFFTRAVSSRDARLSDYAANLEHKVEERTRELDLRNRGMRLLLDNVAQGFLTIDLEGRLAAERSAVVDLWFDAPAAGTQLSAAVRPHAPEFAVWLELGLEALRDGFLPLDVCLAQLPRRFTAGARTFDVAYSPIGAPDSLDRDRGPGHQLLVILSDATEHVASEAAAGEQRELLAVFQRILADRTGCEEFMHEAGELVASLEQPADRLSEDRTLHTLKGSCALFGFEHYAELCHALEGELAEGPAGAALSREQRERLAAGWLVIAGTMSRLLGARPRNAVEIERSELRALAARARSGIAGRELAAVIASWSHEPIARRFERLGDHAIALARRLGKGALAVSISEPGIRLDAARWAPFWNAAIHAVRNAVDHGLPAEAEATRPPALALEAAHAGGRLTVAIRDNGRGIDWEAVAAAARRRELPCETPAALVEALFTDGLSTRERATETSGRGVGLAALRRAVQDLGGTVEVESTLGRGTCISFHIPLQAREREALPSFLRDPPTLETPIPEVALADEGSTFARTGRTY